MVQRGEELRFALEAGQPIGIAGEEVGQDLERDVAPEPRVAGAKHLSHSAFAQLATTSYGPILGRSLSWPLWASARPRHSSRTIPPRAEAGPPAPSWPTIS